MGEQAEAAAVNPKITTAADGKNYLPHLYALPIIIAAGYRVRSTCGKQFRQWASRTLSEYLQQSLVIDDARRCYCFDELFKRTRPHKNAAPSRVRHCSLQRADQLSASRLCTPSTRRWIPSGLAFCSASGSTSSG